PGTRTADLPTDCGKFRVLIVPFLRSASIVRCGTYRTRRCRSLCSWRESSRKLSEPMLGLLNRSGLSGRVHVMAGASQVVEKLAAHQADLAEVGKGGPSPGEERCRTTDPACASSSTPCPSIRVMLPRSGLLKCESAATAHHGAFGLRNGHVRPPAEPALGN